MLDCDLMLSQKPPQPTATLPRCRQVWIEYKGPINQNGCGFKITTDVSTREPTLAERNRAVRAQPRRLLAEPSAFDDLTRAVGHPSVCLAPNVAPSSHSIGTAESRVELD